MSDIAIEPATSGLGDEWGSMTFPSYRSELVALGGSGPGLPVAWTAHDDGRPAGLALARLGTEDPPEAELLSLFVASARRNRGTATALLAALESDLARTGVRRLHGVYMSGKPHVAALERVFAKRGFDPPVHRKVAVQFAPEEPSRAVWYRKARLPDDSVVFPWTDLTADELADLKRSQQERPWIPPALEPWSADPNVDPVSSVGLRRNGEVVGWVINHRMRPDLVAFTISYMRPDLARRGAIFPLYVASLQRLQGTGVLCSFVTDANFADMMRFVLRHVAPYVRYCGETMGVSKVLPAEEAGEAVVR